MNKEKIKRFKERVKEARKRSDITGEFSIFTTIRVIGEGGFFDLNPYLVNLKTLRYEGIMGDEDGRERDLITGRLKEVKLKKILS